MSKYWPVIILFILSIFSVKSLFGPGYFPMHDDTQVSRVIEMGVALKEGQFPVRWVGDLGYGYGYPIFNFYAPLPYYVGGLLYSFGVPALLATKIMFAIGVVLPAFILYAVLIGSVGWQASMAASLYYLYAPYHAVQIYVRGAVGEYWVLIFWPLLVAAFIPGKKKNIGWQSTIVGSIALSGVILTHTLLGYVTVILLAIAMFVYWGIRYTRKHVDWQQMRSHLAIVFLGLGVSSFFWLPAFLEMKFTGVAGQIGATADYHDHFVCISQLWSSLWGFGGSVRGCIDGMSFMLGKLHVLSAVVAIIFWGIIRPKKHLPLFSIGMVMAVVGIFFALGISESAWETLPFFAYIQYPWRFLALAALGMSLLVGVGVAAIPSAVLKTLISVIFVFCLLYLNGKWFTPQYTYMKDSSMFETASDLRWRVSKISDEYLPADLVRPVSEEEAISGTIATGSAVKVMVLEETSVFSRITVAAEKPTEIVIRKAYFPGWKYYINDKEVIPQVRHGLPVFSVNPGQSILVMRFTDTPVRILGNIISLVSLLVLGGIIYDSKKTVR